jgi:NADP-dependent 3-hydroxy acid dehydrogenase YdfG
MRRVIAITGGSSGIGQAAALRLARDGASIAICARRQERLDDVAADIVRAGGRALAVAADVTSADAMQSFVDRTVAEFGTLDVMMCNAGYGLYGAIDRIAPEDVRKVMDVNYFGTYHALRAALPLFRARQAGHLIVVSSIVGQRGVPYMGAYAATKFAQVGLAECLRAELVGSPIRLSVIYPISTETEFFNVMTEHSGFATRAYGPRQTPAEVAEAIAKVLERPAPDVYPQRIARGLTILNALAPGFCDRVVQRWGRKPVEQ